MAESMETLTKQLVEDQQKREELMAQEKAMLQEQIQALQQLVRQLARNSPGGCNRRLSPSHLMGSCTRAQCEDGQINRKRWYWGVPGYVRENDDSVESGPRAVVIKTCPSTYRQSPAALRGYGTGVTMPFWGMQSYEGTTLMPRHIGSDISQLLEERMSPYETST